MDPFCPTPDVSPLEPAQLQARAAEIRASLYDPDARFDPARLRSELQDLLSAARNRPDARPALRQALILMGMVEARFGEPAKGRDLLAEGLGMDLGASSDADELTRDHYFLAGVAVNLRGFALAAVHYGKAAEHARAASGFDLEQQLGIRERHAFALHEAKRYEEALTVNRALLDDGERLLGKDDHRLGTVLVNAAQN